MGLSHHDDFITSDELEVQAELDRLAESQPDNPYVPVAISGSASLLWGEINRIRANGEYANVDSIVVIGGVSLDGFAGIIPGIASTPNSNTNIQQVINIFGDQDFINTEITREWFEERIDVFVDGMRNKEVTISPFSNSALAPLLGPIASLIPGSVFPSYIIKPFNSGVFDPIFDKIKNELKTQIDTLPLDSLAGRKLVKTDFGEGINTINIKLQGIDHHGYVRMPGKSYGCDNLTPVAEEIISWLTKRAYDSNDIRLILTGEYVTYDANSNIYTVTNLKGFRDDLPQP
jgi:hypothetical protein